VSAEKNLLVIFSQQKPAWKKTAYKTRLLSFGKVAWTSQKTKNSDPKFQPKEATCFSAACKKKNMPRSLIY